ncbi:hypothetical protein Bbelb_352380 [Branchiostoma belcheri]|nr:hypothetical protein Bbelb_352380 [Branchiostoma belcheri]
MVPTCVSVANCTDHGLCVDYDTCLCEEQWTGDKCDQFSCAALDYCSGHGSCVDIDVCHCEQGWTGSSCVTPDCPEVNQCSRQGDCVGPNICQCYSGYQGLDCGEAQSCPELQECSGNGVCVNSSKWQMECNCFPGFSGANCNHPDCTEQNNCTNHGSCIEPNLCQCDSGYTGNDCANFSCEALQYCSGHGSCVRFDTCSCDPGWSGRSCNVADCSSKGDCSSQGTCVAPNTCVCFPGFQGEDCSEENVPNAHPPIFQKDRYDATIPENQPVGSPILTVSANDTDSGRNGEVRYRLAQTGLDSENFAVHPTSGIITSVVEFDFESLEHASFSLIVEAFDQGVPTLTGTATVNINITDQNDNKPVINIPPETEYNLQSISPIGFHVTTVHASDADRSDDNSKITYGITSVSPFVSIDATNGSVTVSSALESGTYVLRVRASDHGLPPKTDEVTLRMIVTKVSTNTAPKCPEEKMIQVASGNLTTGSTVATIEAEDADNGPNGDISYSFKSITGELASLFGIDPSTGRIYVATEVPQINSTFSAVSMTVEARDNAVDSMSCETKVVVITYFTEFSGTVPNNVFPTTTTPLTTTSEQQTTPLDESTALPTTERATTTKRYETTTPFGKSTTGSTTKSDITTEETESSTAIPTTERAITTKRYETTTPFGKSTTGSTTQSVITTEETEISTAKISTKKASTTKEDEITTLLVRSTTGSTAHLDITTRESDSSTAHPSTERAKTTKEYETSAAPTATTEELVYVVYALNPTHPIILVPGSVEARLFRGAVKIENREWKDELEDQTSDEFKNLAAEVQEELGNVYRNSDLGGTYHSVEVTGFSPGSVRVDFEVRFNSPTATPIASDDVLAVLEGRTDIGVLQIDHTVTSISEVTKDGESYVWYNNPIYILALCVGAAVIVTILVILVVWRAKRRGSQNATVVQTNLLFQYCLERQSRRKMDIASHNQWPSQNAQRLLQQRILIPRARLSRDSARQMYQNPVGTSLDYETGRPGFDSGSYPNKSEHAPRRCTLGKGTLHDFPHFTQSTTINSTMFVRLILSCLSHGIAEKLPKEDTPFRNNSNLSRKVLHVEFLLRKCQIKLHWLTEKSKTIISTMFVRLILSCLSHSIAEKLPKEDTPFRNNSNLSRKTLHVDFLLRRCQIKLHWLTEKMYTHMRVAPHDALAGPIEVAGHSINGRPPGDDDADLEGGGVAFDARIHFHLGSRLNGLR